MKNIQYILYTMLLAMFCTACQETYNMIPAPNPEDYQKPPAPRFTNIYMVGDATPNGWDIGQCTPMVKSAEDPNIFTWEGKLNTGEMKFPIDEVDNWMAQFFMAGSPNATLETGVVMYMRYSASGDSGSDDKYQVKQAGIYKLTLDALNETLRAELIEAEE